MGLQSWIRKLDSSQIRIEKFLDPGRTSRTLIRSLRGIIHCGKVITLVILGKVEQFAFPRRWSSQDHESTLIKILSKVQFCVGRSSN